MIPETWPKWLLIIIGLALAILTIIIVLILEPLGQAVVPPPEPTPTLHFIAYAGHQSIECQRCHMDKEMLQSTAGSAEDAERAFIEPEYLKNVHSRLGCVTCHKGDGNAQDKETAHKGLKNDPSDDESAFEICDPCHRDLAEQFAGDSAKLAMHDGELREQGVPCSTCHGGVAHKGSPSPHQAVLAYNGANTCETCHPGKEDELLATTHYSYEEYLHRYHPLYLSTAAVNWLGDSGGANCGLCHLSGRIPKPAVSEAEKNELDCLVCHARDYDFGKRAPVEKGGEIVLARDTRLEAAQSVGEHVENVACQRCHDLAGGGKFWARGLLPNNVHTDKGMSCTDCHTVEEHHIAGGASDLKAVDMPDVTLGCTTEGCHSQTPHSDPLYNEKHERLDCRTCHIPYTGGLMFIDLSAKLSFDEKTELYTPAQKVVPPASVRPVYRWYNGQSKGFKPAGNINNPQAKIYPFKLFTATVPADTESGKPLPVDLSLLHRTGDVDKAVRSGVEASGVDYSGEWKFIKQKVYLQLNHGVVKEGALTCADCHGPEAFFDFTALGYSEEEADRLSLSQPVETPAP